MELRLIGRVTTVRDVHMSFDQKGMVLCLEKLRGLVTQNVVPRVYCITRPNLLSSSILWIAFYH